MPSEFGNCWIAAQDATRDLERVMLHGSPLRGVVRVLVPEQAAGAKLGQRATRFQGTVAIERLPAAEWRGVPAVSDSNEALAKSIRSKFDPKSVLNAGIMGETR